MYPTRNLTKGVFKMIGWIKYTAFIFILIFTQCTKEKKPEGLLSEAEMISLMVEMYIAEGKITMSRITRDSAAILFDPYEEALLSKRGLSDSLLKANYDYYLQKPNELERILDAVIDTLSLREQRFAQP